ncbi:MAG: S9 family peptidase [Firmicutes bacterium]|nr:S9 family peptidase [Bacillota bacterium]
MKKLAIDAFCSYHFLSNPTFSPDGTTCVLVDKVADKKNNRYLSTLKLIRFLDDPDLYALNPIRLTSLGNESAFLYDDKDTLLLPLQRRKEDEPEKDGEKTAYYRLPLTGGEAYPVFALPYDVQDLKRVWKGCYAFAAERDLLKPEPATKPGAASAVKADDSGKAGDDADYIREDYADYHVLEEIPYWTDDGDFISRFRTHLYLYDEGKDETICLTEEPLFQLEHFSVRNGRIWYSGESFSEIAPFTSGLYLYDVKTKEKQTIIPEGERIIHFLAAAEDGLFLTMLKEGVKSDWGQDDLYYYDLASNTFTLLMEAIPEVANLVMTDSILGSGNPFKVRDGKLYYAALVRDRVRIFAVDPAGNQEEIPCGDFSPQQFDVKKGMVCFTAMAEDSLQEAYAIRRDSDRVEAVTSCNAEALKDTYVASCHYAGFTNADGMEIDGWYLEPFGFDPAAKYPAILNIHGGPRAAYGTSFFHEMQFWASCGYFVFFCNPRGSGGRGDAFADIRRQYGGIDYEDLMAFTDHILALVPQIDPQRIGVTGGSYGGWMTNWIIGHTDRFRAACSQRSFSNWLSDFSASEIGYSFDVEEIGALPWEDPERLWWSSPAAYVDRMKTPTLFIHSLKDHNCPLSESMQIFAALRYRRIPARAVLFEGEGHGLSRKGKPRHRIRRLQEITDWMDRWLKE